MLIFQVGQKLELPKSVHAIDETRVDPSVLQKKGQKTVLKRYLFEVSDIHLKLEKPIREYYGANIVDRAEKFLDWLNENDTKLTQQFNKDIKDGRLGIEITNEKDLQFVLGFWLGTRYLASRYKIQNPDFPDINRNNVGGIIDGAFGGGAFYDPLTKQFHIDNSFIEEYAPVGISAAIAGINVGIHESTHALPSIRGGSGCKGELCTYYTQSTFGLPLKYEDLSKFAEFGIRNTAVLSQLARTKKIPQTQQELFAEEYLAYLLGPYIKKYYGGQIDIFQIDTGMEDMSGATFTAKYMSKLKNSIPIIGDAKSIEDLLWIWTGSTDLLLKDLLGLKDAKLIEKIDRALKKLRNDDFDDKPAFIRRFHVRMKEEFGEPFKEDIPEGFASLGGPNWPTANMHDIVPKRNYG